MTSSTTPRLLLVADLVRAAVELAVARVRKADRAAVAFDGGSAHLVERVAYAIPRVAARLPWRADCLVQAMAARRWLSAHGIASTIHYGVPRHKAERFEAHAWLTAGDRLVTGGDISGFVPLERQTLLTDAS